VRRKFFDVHAQNEFTSRIAVLNLELAPPVSLRNATLKIISQGAAAAINAA
jgi:hypothetical protein